MKKYYELNTESVITYIKNKTNFFDKDSELECEEIGDGNLNLVFRVRDNNNKILIAKQALPYVRAAGIYWPLDIKRGAIESQALEFEYRLTNGLVPKVYQYDPDMYVILMEDLSDYVIMRHGLFDHNIYPLFAEHMTDFLVKTLLLTSDVVMDHKEKKGLIKKFINPELCEITEKLVYTEPFKKNKRNNIEKGIGQFVEEHLYHDVKLHLEVAKLKFDFMNHAQVLLHGDLHTGSIFVNQEHTKVIDPEFAFFGPMSYDIGTLVANLIMAYISADARIEHIDTREVQKNYLLKTTKQVIDMFSQKFLKLWDTVVTDVMAKTEGFKEGYLAHVLIDTAGVTGCEMIRRTVGFAHVKDLDGIPIEKKRTNAKKTNILMAKELIKNKNNYTKGEDYITLIEKYY